MKTVSFFSSTTPLFLTLVFSACAAHRGPIAHESAQLKHDGKDLLSQGQDLTKQGVDLQNKAKELKVLAEENRKQANTVEAQGDKDKATQFRLEAQRQDAEATEDDFRGRDME